MQFRGDVFHPGAAKMALAQMLQMAFFGGLPLVRILALALT